jgi:hypothetical protein
MSRSAATVERASDPEELDGFEGGAPQLAAKGDQ